MMSAADQIAQLKAEVIELKAKLSAQEKLIEAWRAEQEEWRRLHVALPNPR